MSRRRKRLPPAHEFKRHLARNAGIAAAIISGCLTIGVVGYRFAGHLPWIDALLNASMILSGMGPVDRLERVEGKLFSAGYALFSGVAFITTVSLLLAPALHRFLHAFHLEIADDDADER